MWQVEMVLSRSSGSHIVLNLRFGTLTVTKINGEITFKSATSQSEVPLGLTQARLASLGGHHSNLLGEKSVSQLSYFSRPGLSQTKSTLESNLRSMQSLQQSGQKGYIKASYAATPALEKKRAKDIFSTAGPSPQKSSEHNHLKSFLQTQQDLFKRQEVNYRKSH